MIAPTASPSSPVSSRQRRTGDEHSVQYSFFLVNVVCEDMPRCDIDNLRITLLLNVLSVSVSNLRRVCTDFYVLVRNDLQQPEYLT